jgi:hypothetical protein
MGLNIYQVGDEGDLVMVAEMDDDDAPASPELAVDALLDQAEDDIDGPFAVVFTQNIAIVELDDDETPQPRRKMRVTGSLNGETVVEEVEVEEEEAPAPRRRPGRPKGSTNKSTAKRGPGRPPGSKNKPKSGRGPGRPKGSRNKSRGFRTTSVASDE